MSYTNSEAYDMLKVYFECYENATIAARQYALRYPQRQHFGRRAFENLVKRLKQTGSFKPIRNSRRRRRNNTDIDEINILGYIAADPLVSIRKLACDLGITRYRVHSILKRNRFHPYRIALHQGLKVTDYDKRLDHCNWLKGMLNENPNFLSNIMWSDEATFSSNGSVNRHNLHYWSDHNPHWMQQDFNQGRWSVNVWCGILDGKIIGPFIFDENLNGERYLRFLRDELPILLDDFRCKRNKKTDRAMEEMNMETRKLGNAIKKKRVKATVIKSQRDKKAVSKLGTWNIRSINGKEIELVNEFEKAGLEILIIPETKKKDKGLVEIQN